MLVEGKCSSALVRVLTPIVQLSTPLNIYKLGDLEFFMNLDKRCFEILFVKFCFVGSGVEYFKLE